MLTSKHQTLQLISSQQTQVVAPPDVVLLPGHVVIKTSVELAPADIQISLFLGQRSVRPAAILVARTVDEADDTAQLVFKMRFYEYVMVPNARLQVSVADRLVFDQPLVRGDAPFTGSLDGVFDGHLVGWAANLLGDPIGQIGLQIDEGPEAYVPSTVSDHSYSSLVSEPNVAGLRIELPPEALDGAPHRLTLWIDHSAPMELQWAGDGLKPGSQSKPMKYRDLPYLFDKISYSASYADVARETQTDDRFDPSEHFWTCGIDEGRHPSLFFDIEYVHHRLSRLLDTTLSRRDVLQHYFATPPNQRFVPNRWFSAYVYRARYGELLATELSDFDLFEHYVVNAGLLGLSPSGLFDELAYRARYPDVADALRNGAFRSGFHHFMLLGWRNGCQNLPCFGEGLLASDTRGLEERDTLFYRAGELRQVVPWFSETFYLDVYPDVRELKRYDKVRSGMDHFRAIGCKEGRVPHPALLDAVQRAAGDIRAFDAVVANEPLARLGLLLSVRDATALYNHLTRDVSYDQRIALADIIWPLIEAPGIGGVFKPERYLAANPDLARLYRHDRGRAIEHWRGHGLREGRLAPGSNVFANRQFAIQDLLAGGTGVNVFGPLSLPNGLGVACRGYIKALRQSGVSLETYDVSGLLCPGMLIDIVDPDRLQHSINLIFLNPDQTIPLVARFGTAVFDHRVNVGFWVWELPIPRPEWRAALAGFDLIVTPSKFCTDAFVGETDAPVVTIPYVVDREEIRDQLARYRHHAAVDRAIRAKVAGQKVVLFIMDASSYVARKGVDVFLRLVELAEASSPGKFLFVLKTHARDIDTASRLAEEVPSCVLLIDEVLDRPALFRLKQVADVYFSPHRSEGFGLNIFESLVMGVPVICSPFGGGPDALPSDYPLFLAGRLAEIGSDLGPYRASSVWFEPDPKAALDQLIAFFEQQMDHADYARRLGDKLAAGLTPKAIGKALSAVLAQRCGLGLELYKLAPLFDRPRTECFDIEMGRALNDGSHSISTMIASCISPQFSVVTPTYDSDPLWLSEIYLDLCAQTHQAWEWCLYDDGSTNPATLAALRGLRARDARVKVAFGGKNGGISHATNQAVRISSGQYVVMVDHDDRFHPDMLKVYADAIADGARSDILYCDEDKLFLDGSCGDHYLKPDWSPEHLLSTMYVLHCICVKKSIFLSLNGYRSQFDGAQDHDFILRAASEGAGIRHIDRVLYHWRATHKSVASSAAAKPYAVDAGRRAVLEYMQRLGLQGVVDPGILPGTYRVRPKVPADRVAINILTSATQRPDQPGSYVEALVRSILAYPYDVEVEVRLIVDAQVAQVCAPLAELDPRVTIASYEPIGETFNFAEKANYAIRSADTDRVVLLNDDMETIDGDWLSALLEPLELPGVGVVGGRLLYANDTIQHAGIVLGVNGPATHVFVGNPADCVGYNAFTHVMRNYSAVTGAMMAFRRSTFDRVGGFDVTFPIDFNDTDFCLRVLEIGQRVVFTPFSQMRHFESRSAVRLNADSHDEYRFSRKWRRYLDRDPYYNINLRRGAPTFEAAYQS